MFELGRWIIRKLILGIGGALVLLAALAGYNVVRFYMFLLPSEEVVFDSGGVPIAGTLVLPDADGVFPAILMIHGSGPDTGADPGYRAEANVLARRGFAVLIYAKRGTGKSGGDFATANYSDFIDDALAALRFLDGRADIGSIGLYGHSEGGWFTPEIANRFGDIAFIINKSAAPLSWIDTVIWEVRNDLLAEGATPEELEVLLPLTRARWEYVVAAARDPATAESMRAPLQQRIEAGRAAIPDADGLVADLPAPDGERIAWLAERYAYDPAPHLAAVHVPMLYVYGETDINVPVGECVAFLDRFRADGGNDVTVRVFGGVGHSMTTWRGMFQMLHAPGYLRLVGDWAEAHR